MRPDLTQCYRDHMILMLMQTRGISEKEARDFVESVVKEHGQDRKVSMQARARNGDFVIKDDSLLKFLNKVRDDVLTPSGSAYVRSDKKESVTRAFVLDSLAERGKHKKLQFKYKAAGDEIREAMEYAAQTLIKISCNSLPGGMGSEYNIFYDKGGYNAITSLARSMIAASYTVAEQFLEGNFVFFNIEDAMNHVIINLPNCPPEAEIVSVVSDYQLTMIDSQGLLTYMQHVLKKYHVAEKDTQPLIQLVRSLAPYQCTYLYYLGNFKHLLRDHPHMAKPLIHGIADISKVDGIHENPKDLFNIDEDIKMVCTLLFSSQLDGLQPYELPEKNPEKAKKFVAAAKHIESSIGKLDRLWNTFVSSPFNVTRANSKKDAYRETVVLSDTDSVVFSVANWVEWYTGNTFVSDDAYAISALMIYWLLKIVGEEMKKWSVSHGAASSDLERMVMKNEFLFPAMLLFDIKKTYAAIKTVNEGLVMPEAEAEIKGVLLKGSVISKPAVKFTENFIVEEILKPSLVRDISGKHLINQLVKFETTIRASVEKGELEYVPLTSYNPEENYKNPWSTSTFLRWYTWETVFGDRHGHMMPPLKAPDVPLISKPPLTYFEWLAKNHPETNKQFQVVIKKLGKMPSGIAINPIYGKIPEELLPIVDVRALIHAAVKPSYRTLLNMNMPVLYGDQQLLLSDVYIDDDPNIRVA